MSLAHEIGHHAMGHLTEHKRADTQAKAFASALLMPADDFGVTWPSILTIDTLTQLKQHWGVSIQGLLYRAHMLGIISQRVHLNWIVDFSRTGRRKNEPGYVIPEKPSTIPQVLTALTEQLGVAPHDLAEAYGWLSDEFQGIFSTSRPKALVLKAPLPADVESPEEAPDLQRPTRPSDKIIKMPDQFLQS
jgi:hypothetical protein